MDEVTCPYCGHHAVTPGFLEDSGQAARGFTRWVEGPLERGLFGGARLMGKSRWEVEAHRCPECSFLVLFAPRRA